MNTIDATCDQRQDDRTVFVTLLGLYSLILLPILRANRYYNDDLKRALIGRTGWDATGRPLTNLLMRMLQCYDHAMVDISPLPQIGAIAILAWVGVLIARRYAITPPWLAALLALPLGGQPFFLENLSYKFDALSMGLAVLLALLPVLALKDDRRGWWLGVLALFGSLNFYQPAINAYLVFVLLDLVLAQLDDLPPRRLARQLSVRALQLAAAMLIYHVLVGIHINGWVKQRGEMIHGLHELPRVISNGFDFYGFVVDSFNGHWWMYFAPLLGLMALVPVAIGFGYARRIRHDQGASVGVLMLVVTVLLPVIALASALGPMLLLVDPLIAPRVLIGMGALLAVILIVVQTALRRWRWSDRWVASAACMLALGMASFASAYGNAQEEQKNYEDRIASRLADDLSELKASRSIDSFLVDGTPGYSPITAHVAEQFPLMRTLVPTYISSEDNFHTHIFLKYYVSEVADLGLKPNDAMSKLASTALAETCKVAPTHTTSAYRLYVVDRTAVVTFLSHRQHCAAPSMQATSAVP